MSKSPLELLEKMRASREELAHQLDQLAERRRPVALTALKKNVTSRIAMAVGLALAIAVLFPARRPRDVRG